MADTTKKIVALESIRGIAALVVVFWHWASIFFPAMMSGPSAFIHNPFEIIVYQSPLSFFLTGNFAVVIFFMLSGFVLTLKYFQHKQISLFPAAIKRYVRLMPIVLASTLLGYVVLSAGLIYAQEAGVISRSMYLTNAYYYFNPSLTHALAQGLLLVFTQPWPADASYNPTLWTIYYEMLGAMLVFGFATLVRGKPKRWLLYCIAIVAFINTYFVGFLVGCALADVYASRNDIYEKIGNARLVYKLLALVLAFSIAAYPFAGSYDGFGPYWRALTFFPTNIVDSRTILQLIAGSIFISLALVWNSYARALGIRPLQWLGKISYALYATHFILLYSLTCWLLVVLTSRGLRYGIATVLALVVSLPVMLLVSALFHRFIEEPSIRFANSVGRWLKQTR